MRRHCTRQDEERRKPESDRRAFDTADNPPLASGGMSRTQKTGGPVFSELLAEYHYDIHEMGEIKEAIEDYYS